MDFISVFLYDVGIFFYSVVAKIASLNNQKAKLFIDGRKNIFDAISAKLKNDTHPKIWFHCASLGEFEQARPIIESIKATHPQYKVIVTFFSPSGYEFRKKYDQADYIFYLPLDTKSNAQKLISLFNPSTVFFVKYEFWFHYLTQLHQQKIPTYLISANFRTNQLFFKWYGSFFKKLLQYFEIIFTQNEESKKLLNEIGINHVIVSKDSRFDRVYTTIKNVQSLPIIEQFKHKNLLIIAGSSYTPEENLINNFLLQTSQKIKIIIAPHEIDSAHIKTIEHTFANFKTILYSNANTSNVIDKQVLIIDNIGLLSSIYQYGDIALIGGGFAKKGLHNMLEAAAFGMPILFGPNNHDKFPEANQMIKYGVAFTVYNNNLEFNHLMDEFISNTEKRNKISSLSKKFITENIGSTEIILSTIKF